jgi:hypothetical protein
MKTVKSPEGEVTRVKDEQADQLVKNKKYMFVPKKDFKELNKKKNS